MPEQPVHERTDPDRSAWVAGTEIERVLLEAPTDASLLDDVAAVRGEAVEVVRV
jgi:hypothetical protein